MWFVSCTSTRATALPEDTGIGDISNRQRQAGKSHPTFIQTRELGLGPTGPPRGAQLPQCRGTVTWTRRSAPFWADDRSFHQRLGAPCTAWDVWKATRNKTPGPSHRVIGGNGSTQGRVSEHTVGLPVLKM